MDQERNNFRLIKQYENESFRNFVKRLRDQAEKCKFPDHEQTIKDQILEKSFLREHRAYIFQFKMNLEQLIDTGILLAGENTRTGTSRQSNSRLHQRWSFVDQANENNARTRVNDIQSRRSNSAVQVSSTENNDRQRAPSSSRRPTPYSENTASGSKYVGESRIKIFSS